MRESAYNFWVDRGEDQYVFNGVSGKMAHLDRSKYDGVQQFIETGSTANVTTDVLEALVEHRVLIADSTDELAVLEGRYKASRFDPSRLGLTILTSLGCNFACPYCFEDKHPSLLGPGTQEAILDLVRDHAPQLKNLSVTWFGGEPLLGKEALYELSDKLLAICAEHDIEYYASIITNGWHLDEETAIALKARGVKGAQITIDGPPDIHNSMRPHVNGGGTFDRIVENLKTAVDHLPINVRVSLDRASARRVEELFGLFIDAGLAGRVNVYPGHLIDYDHHPSAPAASYEGSCFGREEFAMAEREFFELAQFMGIGDGMGTPHPTTSPCTAVRANEIIVGSDGELYKCWDDVGNPEQVVGHISDYTDINSRLHRWLAYDPFENDECRSCPALPVCMGGCAHHAMIPEQYDNRCGTFKHRQHELIEAVVDDLRSPDRVITPNLDLLAPMPGDTRHVASSGVPVVLRRKPAMATT